MTYWKDGARLVQWKWVSLSRQLFPSLGPVRSFLAHSFSLKRAGSTPVRLKRTLRSDKANHGTPGPTTDNAARREASNDPTPADAGAPPADLFPPEIYGEPLNYTNSDHDALRRGVSNAWSLRDLRAAALWPAVARWPQRRTRPPIRETPTGTPFVSQFFELPPGHMVRYLEDKGLEVRMMDQHAVVRICPFCPPVRGKADNMFKLYVHTSSGVFFCHRCGAKGNHWDLKRSFGDILEPLSWRGQFPENAHLAPGAHPTSARPADSGAASVSANTSRIDSVATEQLPVVDAALAAQCEARLESSDAVKQFLKSRGLQLATARKFRVGAGRFRFRDSGSTADIWSEHDCITFPWIEPEWLTTRAPSTLVELDHRRDPNPAGSNLGSEESACQDSSVPPPSRVLRLKIRSVLRKSAMRLEPRGGYWGLFGMHLVPADAECLVVTEGEFDAMAVHQSTGLSAVSLPNGARSLPPALLTWLERFKRIYLWLDDDIPGHDGARQFAHKLGLQRCFLVGSGNGSGPKDANEALLQQRDLFAMIERARPVPHERIVTFADLRADVQRELANPVQVRGLQSQTLPGLNRLLKGHRRGELTIFSGPTGVGKTTVLSQLSLDYCMQGANTLWGSFELNNVRMAKVMLSQFAGIGLDAMGERFDQVADQFEQLPLYFLRFFGSSDVDQVIHAMEYAAYVYDVAHVVLDNLQFMTSGQGRGYERFEIMDRAIEKFRAFATEHNVHVSVVIHPRKEDEDQLLKTASVFGSAKATQEADNVIIIQNGRHYKYLDVRKNRFDGELGNIPYRFDPVTRRIRELLPDEIQQLEDGYRVCS